MKAVEYRLPQEFGKSFIVFEEKGAFFPVPWHYHPEYEFVLVTKSRGRRMVGDHIGYFDEDDLVFMGSHLPHVWINDPEFLDGKADYEASAIVIHFVYNFMGEGFFNLPELEPIKKILRLSKRGLVIKGKTRDEINALMKNMMSLNGIQRLASLFMIFDILINSNEYDLLTSPGYEETIQINGRDRFSAITEYVMKNFDREITLPEIASVANMAITTFCNFFKEHYRVTFVEYLNSVRIGYACKLLNEDDQSIMEIAYSCGFNSLANFNKQFRKIKGMSPREFRKTIEG